MTKGYISIFSKAEELRFNFINMRATVKFRERVQEICEKGGGACIGALANQKVDMSHEV